MTDNQQAERETVVFGMMQPTRYGDRFLLCEATTGVHRDTADMIDEAQNSGAWMACSIVAEVVR